MPQEADEVTHRVGGVRPRVAGSSADQRKLVEALEEFTELVASGQPPDHAAFLQQHPTIADELADCLAGLEQMQQLAPEVSDAPEAFGSARRAPSTKRPTLGEFQLLRQIARGGMGVVYEALQPSLSRRVAIKVLSLATSLDSLRLRRFCNEATAAAQLRHPNIVDIYSVGSDRGIHYFAMEFIDGASLAEVIGTLRAENDSSATLDSVAAAAAVASQRWLESVGSPHSRQFHRAVARLGIEVAAGLEHAHQMGIVHRDIKPSNLLLDAQGTVRIADFGLAQTPQEATLTITGEVLGTLRYMSPEQLCGKRGVVTHRTDIYSLGATLYELLTLERLMPGEERHEILQNQLKHEPVAPRRIVPSIPKELETIVLKALQEQPGDRYATAQDLADDLQRFIEDRPILARPPTFLDRATKWSRRHRTLVRLCLGFLVLSVVALTASTILVWNARQEAVRESRNANEQKRLVVQREKSLEQQLYATDIATAARNIEQGYRESAHDLLRRWNPRPDGQPDRRGFEWFLLDSMLRPEGVLARANVSRASCPRCGATHELRAHSSNCYWLAYSADGKWLATAGGDRAVRVWDVLTGESIARLEHAEEANVAAFSPDGQWLATAGDDQTVRLWGTRSWQPEGTWSGQMDPIIGLYWSPDSNTIYSAGRWTLQVRDVPSGDVRYSLGNESPLALSGDGRFMLLARVDRDQVSDGSVCIRETTQFDLQTEFRGHAGLVVCGAFSNDNRTLATGGRDSTVRLWDAASGSLRATLAAHFGYVESVDFSDDDTSLVSCGQDGVVRLWDLGSNCLRRTLVCDPGVRAWQALFSPDRSQVAVARGNGHVSFFDLRAVVERSLAAGEPAEHFFDADLVTILGDLRQAPIADARLAPISGRTQAGPRPGSAWSVSPNGAVAFCDASGRIVISRGAADSAKELEPGIRVDSLEFSACGSFLLVHSVEHGSLLVWNVGEHRCQLEETLTDVAGFTTTRDEDWLITRDGRGGEITVRALKSGRIELQRATDLPRELRFMSPPFRLDDVLVRDANGLLHRLRLDGAGEDPILLAQPRPPTDAALDPAGRLLATAHEDGQVTLWELVSGRELFSWRAHQRNVDRLSFTPDGQGLVTLGKCAGGRREVRVWTGTRDATTAPDVASKDLTPGLVAYWPLDGDSDDPGSSSRGLRLQGPTGWREGVHGNSLHLPGDPLAFASRPVHDDVFDLGDTDFTIQVWVRFESSAGLEESVLIEALDQSGGPGWTLTRIRDHLHFFAGSDFDSPPCDFQDGVLYQVVARRAGGRFTLHVDARELVHGSLGPVRATSRPLLLGRRNDGDPRRMPLHGCLDEVAIWNRALSQSEIEYLYNDGRGRTVLGWSAPFDTP